MPASPQDFYKKVGANTVTTLAAPGKNLAATSINVGSTTNYPTDTGIVVGIRVVDSNGTIVPGTYTEWNAVVASSTAITIEAVPVYGTDQVYPAGSLTQVFLMVSSSLHNQMVDGLLTEHTQSGGHKSNISVNGQPLSDFVLSVSGGWANLTDTWTYSAWNATSKIATINVPSDATARYSVGMKIKFTQSTGGTKYGQVATVSATQITAAIVSGTLENEAITAPAYSVVESPFGYPRFNSLRNVGFDYATYSGGFLTTTDQLFNTVTGDTFGNKCIIELTTRASIPSASGASRPYYVWLKENGSTLVIPYYTAIYQASTEVYYSYSFEMASTPAAGSNTWEFLARTNAGAGMKQHESSLKVTEIMP